MKDEIRTDVKKHTRTNQTILGAIERPALDWLVRRMPGWISPDHLTVFGLLSAILIGVSYFLTRYNSVFLWLASLGFIFNWLGDSLDGNLARFRKIERPKFGFFIDHTIDGLAEVCICVGLGLSPYFSFNLAMVALIGYMLVSSLVYIYTYVSGEFRISYIRLGPTEVRVSAVLINTIIYFLGNPTITLFNTKILFYDVFLVVFILLFFIGYLVLMISKSIELSKLECKPVPVKKSNRLEPEIESVHILH